MRKSTNGLSTPIKKFIMGKLSGTEFRAAFLSVLSTLRYCEILYAPGLKRCLKNQISFVMNPLLTCTNSVTVLITRSCHLLNMLTILAKIKNGRYSKKLKKFLT